MDAQVKGNITVSTIVNKTANSACVIRASKFVTRNKQTVY